MRLFAVTATFLLTVPHVRAARLSPSAAAEFARYTGEVETRLARQHSSPDTCVGQRESGSTRGLSGALLHHWRAASFVPHATPQDMLALLRDYNHFSNFYSPRVLSSRALTDGVAMRLQEKKVVTVVLDAEYQVETRLEGNGCGYSLSRSTHIWQVEDAGTAHEHRRTEGDDDGFLWRLNSYWSFIPDEARSGLWIECEAVSLTRDVPRGLGWLLRPMVQQLPREVLEFTLNATKKALNRSLRSRLGEQ